MTRTIKGKLTISVVLIVAVSILITAVGFIVVAGRRMIQDQTQVLQLNAEKYAEEINAWIEDERMLAAGTANSIMAVGDMSDAMLQSVVDAHAADRDELLNLYCGTKDHKFIQSNQEAGIPEGAKLYAEANRGDHSIAIYLADYAHDLRDVPPDLMEILLASNVCLAELEEQLIREDNIYGG